MKVDNDILNAIDMRLPNDLDEAEIRWWLTVIPEAKRYILRKIKKCNRKINDCNTIMELLEEKYLRKYAFRYHVDTDGFSSTDKKAYAKNKMIFSKQYQAIAKEMNIVTEEIDELNAVLENLNDKSLAVRKLSNFELNHMFEE